MDKCGLMSRLEGILQGNKLVEEAETDKLMPP